MKEWLTGSPEKIKSALEHAKKHGDSTWILPLLEAYAARPEDALREEMAGLLSTLKISAAEDVFLDALSLDHLKAIRADVLGFLWSCGFTCEGNLTKVAEVACDGDFRQALEGSTLMEQVETATNERDILGAQVTVAEALQDPNKESIQPFVEAMARHLAMLSDTLH